MQVLRNESDEQGLTLTCRKAAF